MELDFVEWLRDRLPATPDGVLGVGDDAALIRVASGQLVATSDLLIDGVHFRLGEHAPERIGRKTLAVNLSDLAAMATRPVGALVSLALPRGGDANDALARRLIEGMLPLAEEFGCPIVGGDTNVGPGPLVISVTAFGEPTEQGVVRRDGAKPGDWALATGDGLGGSLLGGHLDFTPRVREALRLVELADIHAMMDLSDGIALDFRRLCQASGVGAVVHAERIPVSEAASRRAEESGKTPLEHALTDGEDFELLFTVSSDAGSDLLERSPLECELTKIGEVVEEPAGVRLLRGDGTTELLAAGGYEHQ